MKLRFTVEFDYEPNPEHYPEDQRTPEAIAKIELGNLIDDTEAVMMLVPFEEIRFSCEPVDEKKGRRILVKDIQAACEKAGIDCHDLGTVRTHPASLMIRAEKGIDPDDLEEAWSSAVDPIVWLSEQLGVSLDYMSGFYDGAERVPPMSGYERYEEYSIGYIDGWYATYALSKGGNS